MCKVAFNCWSAVVRVRSCTRLGEAAAWRPVLLMLAMAATEGALAQRQSWPLGDGPWDYLTYEQDTAIRVSVVARNLSHPWSMAFLPGTATAAYPLGDVLITEREGRIRLLRQGRLLDEAVADLSDLSMDILFDLALHPDFSNNKLVYFTYMKQAPAPDGSAGYWATTALARGRFDGSAVTDISDVFVADAWSANQGSDASRIVFAADGTLYMSSSHRRDPVAPQDPGSPVGKMLRLTDDGRPAPGNPFIGQEQARPEVFSYGHRTVLGLTVHPLTGAVWEAENGPQGGDEVNVLQPGRNYGWPEVTYGRDYDGKVLNASPWRADVEPPELVWIPSITVTGITFYTGDKFPAWQNNLFVGAMTTGRLPGTGHIERIVFNEYGEQRREALLNDLHQRVRDIRQGPDGLLYLLTDEDAGALLRIEPIAEPVYTAAPAAANSATATPR